jgi:hypothetical protein
MAFQIMIQQLVSSARNIRKKPINTARYSADSNKQHKDHIPTTGKGGKGGRGTFVNNCFQYE